MSAEADQQLVATALALAADRAGAEAVAAMGAAGIDPVLLKGATIARWLYGDTARPYGDVDLLVDPERRQEAADVLARLGYRPVPFEVSPHAHPWVRERDAAHIDLHHALFGPRCSPRRCWRALQDWLEPTELASVPVSALAAPGRLLLVVLHASQHGDAEKPLEDLRRAVISVPEPVWREAERLADRIDALHRMEHGLGLIPEGNAMVDRLPLVRAARLADAVNAPLAVSFARLAQAHGVRGWLAAVRAALAPPPEPLESPGAGAPSLLLARARARVRQVVSLPVRLVRTLQVRRSRKEVGIRH